MATWYLQSDNWDNVENWTENWDGTGSHPPEIPWTGIVTRGDDLEEGSGYTNWCVSYVALNGGTGVCTITGVVILGGVYGGIYTGAGMNNQGEIVDGTFTGDHFWALGTIIGGTFTGFGGTLDNGANIFGGIFTGNVLTSYASIYNGNFSLTGFTCYGNIYRGEFLITDFYNYYGNIYGGIFIVDNFVNLYGIILGGWFVGIGDGFVNDDGATVYSGTFTGNFNNYGLFYTGVWWQRGSVKINSMSIKASGDPCPEGPFTILETSDILGAGLL